MDIVRLVHSWHKKWSFPLRISSVNVTKSTGNCELGHIYWRNPSWNTSFFVQWLKPKTNKSEDKSIRNTNDINYNDDNRNNDTNIWWSLS